MKGRRSAAGGILLAAVLITGCAGTMRAPALPSETGLEELLFRIERHALKVYTFQGHARLSLYTPEGPFRGSLDLVTRMPDSLRLKVEGPLGVDVALGTLAGDSMVLYSPWQSAVYRGTVSRMQELHLLPLADEADFTAMVMGLAVPNPVRRQEIVYFAPENGKYRLSFRNGEEIWVDPRGPMVTHWERNDSTGTPLWTWEASDFRYKQSIYLPKRVSMTAPGSGRRVTLYYEKIVLNRALPGDWHSLKIPEGASHIEL